MRAHGLALPPGLKLPSHILIDSLKSSSINILMLVVAQDCTLEAEESIKGNIYWLEHNLQDVTNWLNAHV